MPSAIAVMRRLADAGRAAEQDERAGDEAAAEDPVELPDAGSEAFLLGSDDVAKLHRLRRGGTAPAGRARPGVLAGRLDDDLIERVPLRAAGALPGPRERGVAAFAADVLGSGLRHRLRSFQARRTHTAPRLRPPNDEAPRPAPSVEPSGGRCRHRGRAGAQTPGSPAAISSTVDGQGAGDCARCRPGSRSARATGGVAVVEPPSHRWTATGR